MKIFLVFVGFALAQSDIQASLKPLPDSIAGHSQPVSPDPSAPPRVLQKVNARKLQKKMAELKAKENMKKLVAELSFEHPKFARRLAKMTLSRQMQAISQKKSIFGSLFKGKPLKQLARAGLLGMIMIPKLTQNYQLKRLNREYNKLRPTYLESKRRKQAEVARVERLVDKLEETLQLLSDSTAQRITELDNFVDATLRI